MSSVALVCGKPATPKVPQLRPSTSVGWEDSDSSVDSVQSSPSSSNGDPDWPLSPGYEVTFIAFYSQRDTLLYVQKLRTRSPTYPGPVNTSSIPHSATFSTSSEVYIVQILIGAI